MRNFINTDVARSLIGTAQAKNQLLSVTYIKKDGNERKFTLRMCAENAPSFARHPNLCSIREPVKQADGSYKTAYRSFDISRLTYIAADKNKVYAT